MPCPPQRLPLPPSRGCFRLPRPHPQALSPPTPEETATLRKHAIIALISALRPNDSVEAARAAGFIITNEQSRDRDHWVQIHLGAERYKCANQCRAQAINQERDRARPKVGAPESRSQTTIREAKRALRELERRQAATKKRHADPAATDAAEHITTILLAEGHDRLPQPQKPEPAPPPS